MNPCTRITEHQSKLVRYLQTVDAGWEEATSHAEIRHARHRVWWLTHLFMRVLANDCSM